MERLHKKERLDKKIKMKKLFLIHSIIQSYSEEGLPLNNFNLILFPVIEHNLTLEPDDNPPDVEIHEVEIGDIQGFFEGQFVYIRKRKNDKIQLIKGNKDLRARQHIMTNNRLRSSIISASSDPEPTDFQGSDNGDIWSYHVNVGHGNCSLLVIKNNNVVKIWCVDCSEWDYINKKHYRENIEKCLEYIRKKFNLDKVEIEKFFLTHSHYDHFSGFIYLIKNKAASKAEFWFNPFFSFSTSSYNHLLNLLNNYIISGKIKVVDSYPWNDTLNIKILNDDRPILRTKPRTGHTGISRLVGSGRLASLRTPIIQKNVNNSSILFQFVFGKKSILFPGDIEDDGWAYISKCIPNLSTSNYYCLSHHGSLNGHIRKSCPLGLSINNVTLCNTQTNILFIQGRDGAYPGIISKKLLSDFKTTHPMKTIFRTDQDPKGRLDPIFFEIDWKSDSVKHYF